VARHLAVILAAGLCGCANDPVSMGRSEIEARLAEKLNLRDVSLAAAPAGGYTGTGRKADGTAVTITVTQKKDEQSLWYSAVDEKGELSAGGMKDIAFLGVNPSAVRWWRRIKVIALVAVVVGGAGYAIWSRRRAGAKPGEAAG
jgi:hypothetical protein